MVLNDIADRREQAGNILALDPLTAAGIKNRFQLLDNKRHIATAPEYRATCDAVAAGGYRELHFA